MNYLSFDSALLLARTAPVAIAVLDQELKYLAHSPRWISDYALQNQSSLIGRCHYEVFPEIPDRWKDHHQRALKGEVLNSEAEVASKDDAFNRQSGIIDHLRWALYPWTKDDHEIGGIVMVTEARTENKRLEDKLEVAQHLFHAFMNNTAAVAFMKDVEGKYVYTNREMHRMFSTSHDDINGKTDFDWLPKNIARAVRASDIKVLNTGQKLQQIEMVPTPDGEEHHWLVYKFPFVDDHGESHVGGVAFDVTEQKRLETQLSKERDFAHTTLASIGDAVIATDRRGRVEYMNPKAEEMTEYTLEEAYGHSILSILKLVDADTREPLESPVHRAIKTRKSSGIPDNTLLISATNRERGIQDSAAPIFNVDGELTGVVIVFHDVTEARQLSRQLAEQASQDSLTGVMNRGAFEVRLSQVVVDAQQDNTIHSLCYLDLDQFKVINDTCGHSAGDQLLQQVAMLIQGGLRKTDILARLGGDEFGILLMDCNVAQALKVINDIRQTLLEFRFVHKNRSFNVGCSAGVTEINAQVRDGVEVLGHADVACYAAKDNGRNRVHVYRKNDAELAKQRQERQWIIDIQDALEEERFVLCYQPIQSISTHEKRHHEVLLRMIDREGTKISPNVFIPAAERYNKMAEVDRWVISRFFQELTSCLPQDDSRMYAINISGSTITDETFLQFLRAQLEEYQVNPKQLCFEITETCAISNFHTAKAFINNLKEIGCQFALDDFGTGMSSFTYLKHLEAVDYVKIDGNFVRSIGESPRNQTIVEAIHRIASVHDMKTIAEFVEDKAILEKLRTIGIDFAQGYAIGEPKQELSCSYSYFNKGA
ncbi:EAL domain-containing protein [Oscillatoria sp. CS-180]|uniref:bifunctional diguanylate cyclase/phosphodiesterase n=1 Tax=Oscillatoria sp. CS-180 TaxID=3021720 RepID=UPI00232D307A|nr:EAL domain-containing protein [Oscillatoria sp. CS-180]MDB9526456.1 EAL domain-containing protein [Oscillatoria sp. CS-180]